MTCFNGTEVVYDRPPVLLRMVRDLKTLQFE